MEAQSDTLKEILSELFALLETQETNSTAVLQLLKDQGIASDEKLSTYLDQAGKASNVKWRAARMRMEYLLTPIQKETAGSDKSQPEPKESQSPEAVNKLKEDQRNNQAKDNQAKGNANKKEQEEASTKSTGKDIAEESGDPKRDAGNGAPKDNEHTSSKQTA